MKQQIGNGEQYKHQSRKPVRKRTSARQWWRTYYVYIVSSLLIVGTILAVMALKGFWPFGDSMFLNGDFALQSYPYLEEFKHKLATGESLLYTWNVGYGTNYFSIFTTIINPFTLLFLLVPSQYILSCGTIVFILIEVAMNGTMLYFLTHRPYRHLEQSRPANMLFSLSYALCMYALSNVNNWHMMVCAVYFPLIILGLERFVANKDWKLYYVMLTLSFLCGYYMTALFSFFIIFYYLTLEFGSAKVFWRKSFKILGISLASIVSSAIVILPTFVQILRQDYTISEMQTDHWFTTYFDILKNFFALNMAVDRGTAADSYGEVNLFFGLLPLMLTTFYFLNPKIKKSVRLKKLAVVLIYMLAFNWNVLNYVMHLFHYPSWFPNRFAICFTFLCILLAYESWITLEETEFRYATLLRGIAIGLGWSVITVLCFAFAKEVLYQFTYSVSIMLFLFYMIMFLFLPYGRNKLAKVLNAIGCIELMLCFAFTIIFRFTNANMPALEQVAIDKKEFIEAHPLEEAYGFSRSISNGELIKMNESMLYNQKGNAIFSSSIANTGKFLQPMGVSVGKNFISPFTYNQATFSLMNVQYFLDNQIVLSLASPNQLYSSAESIYDHYPAVVSQDGYTFYENPTVLSLGYMIDPDADTAFPEDLEQYYVDILSSGQLGINDWIEGICGVPDVMEEGDGLVLTSIKALNCHAVVADGNYLLSKGIQQEDIVGLDFDREDVFTDFSMEEYQPGEQSGLRLDYVAEEAGEYYIEIVSEIVTTGYLEKGEEIHIYYEVEDGFFDENVSGRGNIVQFHLNEEQWQKAYEILAKQQLQVTGYTATTVDGTIQVNEDGILFTSIPYDRNWHMYVDGEEVDILPLWSGSFVATRLGAGEHTVHLQYRQSGLLLGTILSVGMIALTVCYIVLERKKRMIWLLEPPEVYGEIPSDESVDRKAEKTPVSDDRMNEERRNDDDQL